MALAYAIVQFDDESRGSEIVQAHERSRTTVIEDGAEQVWPRALESIYRLHLITDEAELRAVEGRELQKQTKLELVAVLTLVHKDVTLLLAAQIVSEFLIIVQVKVKVPNHGFYWFLDQKSPRFLLRALAVLDDLLIAEAVYGGEADVRVTRFFAFVTLPELIRGRVGE